MSSRLPCFDGLLAYKKVMMCLNNKLISVETLDLSMVSNQVLSISDVRFVLSDM